MKDTLRTSRPRIPVDVLREVVDWAAQILPSSSLAALALVSRDMYHCAAPFLFQVVTLKSGRDVATYLAPSIGTYPPSALALLAPDSVIYTTQPDYSISRPMYYKYDSDGEPLLFPFKLTEDEAKSIIPLAERASYSRNLMTRGAAVRLLSWVPGFQPRSLFVIVHDATDWECLRSALKCTTWPHLTHLTLDIRDFFLLRAISEGMRQGGRLQALTHLALLVKPGVAPCADDIESILARPACQMVVFCTGFLGAAALRFILRRLRDSQNRLFVRPSFGWGEWEADARGYQSIWDPEILSPLFEQY